METADQTQSTDGANSDSLTDRGTYAGSVSRLSEGDSVLWDGRANPLTVIEPAHEAGDHSDVLEVAVEGPRGGVVTLRERFQGWKTASGRVETVVITEKTDPEPRATDGEDFVTDWHDPSDDCPHCGHTRLESLSADFHCEYLTSAQFGENDGRVIGVTDSGAQRRLLRATCVDCGGVVYEHPAWALLNADEPPQF